MTSDETQIQIFADWPMSHAKRVAKDNLTLENISRKALRLVFAIR